jgi:hypothetical protein
VWIVALVVAWEFLSVWMPWFLAINCVEIGRKEQAAKLLEPRSAN